MRLSRSLELPEGLLASLAHDLIHEGRWSAHLVLDVPTQGGLGFGNLLRLHPRSLLTHRSPDPCDLLSSEPPCSI